MVSVVCESLLDLKMATNFVWKTWTILICLHYSSMVKGMGKFSEDLWSRTGRKPAPNYKVDSI